MQHERKLILLLCAIAAARVFVFSAAFPFFNNVDEQAHVDLVMKYSRREPPRELGHYSLETAHYIALFASPEFMMAPEKFETNEFPPPNWKLPVAQRNAAINGISAFWLSKENHESGEPPLYYAIAGLWLNLGRAFGITGGWLLYWVRFLNVFVAGALVWVGYVSPKLVFPDRPFIHLSVPILLAVWPQSTFYSIQSDPLSPLCFGIAFVGLIKFSRDDPTSLPLATGTGLALAATCLSKTSNIALLLVAGLALVFKIRDLAQRRTLRLRWVSLVVLIGSAAVPIALWLTWNVHTFGDLTASSSKIDFLGWTRKPASDWWPHPIFTMNGVKEFWPELLASFWRGEFIWHGKRLALKASDTFYWISSALAIGVAAFSLFPRLTKLTRFQRESLWLAFSSFVVLVSFVAFLSMAFDFGTCLYPSREHPYFTSGRLLSAAAVPFFLLYAWALDWATSRVTSNGLRLLVFGGIVAALTIPQTVLDARTFSSRYNFFHLGGSTTIAVPFVAPLENGPHPVLGAGPEDRTKLPPGSNV